MASGITLKETAAASIPTPGTDKGTLFLDSVSGLPKFKDDAGTVTGFVGAAGTNGTNGTNGAGYLATSTTSLATAGSGSKAFTTQAGLAYTAGARIRATSAGTAEWMEGVVTAYSSTTLTATMDANSGTGTHADWNINLAGEKGATGATGAAGGAGPETCAFRLTLESGVPVSVTDQTAKTTIYCEPYKGNTMALYSGSAWAGLASAAVSIPLGTLTSGANYDVFAYNNSGTLTLEFSAAWTSDTVRADALALQDGVLVKSADHTRRYLGTFRTTSTTTTEDSGGGTTTQVGGKRFLWNYYNRIMRSAKVIDTTDTWSYGTATWRQANGASGNKVEWVIGVNEDQLIADLVANTNISGLSGTMTAGIGVDSTTAPATGTINGDVYRQDSNAVNIPIPAHWRGHPGIGYHYLAWIEKGNGGTTKTFTGDDVGDGSQSGLASHLMG